MDDREVQVHGAAFGKDAAAVAPGLLLIVLERIQINHRVLRQEGEELYSRIVGYPLEICEMMHEEGREEEAVANLFYLLEKMGDLYKSNPDLFENKTGSLVPKLELMMWWLTELYFIVKGNPAVNDDIKSDMDFFLMDLQRRTQLFDEASSKWDDMFVDNQPYAEDDGLWKHYKEHMEMRNSV